MFVICYNVRHKPKAAGKLNIPLNEIWISEKWKNKEENILLHKLKEIKYRHKGYDEKEAHKKAIR